MEKLENGLQPYSGATPLIPSTNEVCEGYVFTGVCLSTGGCLPLVLRGVCHTRHPPRQTPLGRYPPWADTPLPSACWDTHPPAQCMLGYPPKPSGYYGIRSTSGRYASHWNAMHSCFNENRIASFIAVLTLLLSVNGPSVILEDWGVRYIAWLHNTTWTVQGSFTAEIY